MSSKSRLFLSCLGITSLFMLSACDPKPGSHHELSVGPDQILAADVRGDEMEYWIFNEVGASVDHDTITVSPGTYGLGGSITVTADSAAGIYLTTPTYSSQPSYTVSFEGSVSPGAVASYVDTDTDGFNDLRGSDDVAAMQAFHTDISAAASTVKANWALDSEQHNQDLTTVAYDMVTGSQSDLQDGVSILLDSDDLDAAEAGTSGLAPWVTDVESEMGEIEPQALADAGVASAETTTMETDAPDEAALQAAIEACMDLQTWGDEIEANLTKYYPDTRKEVDYDGRNDDVEGEISDEQSYSNELEVESYLEDQEAAAAAVQACIEEAIGGEPQVSYTETSPDPYQDIADNTQALADAGEADTLAYEGGLETQWSAEMEGDATAAWTADDWRGPADSASAVIQGVLGEDMFADTVAPGGGGAVPGYATSKQDSSFTECQDTTWVFAFDLAGLGVVIGTPFNDVIRGDDEEDGFEVMWGGKGDDCMNGLKGHELIMGGPGNDELHGGDQHELILGGPGDDLIYAGDGAAYTFTVYGVDVEIELGSVIFGGRGDDIISGGDPSFDETDLLEFGYTDLIFGDGLSSATAGDDIIEGGAGIDFLFGQWGNDSLRNRRSGRVQFDGVPWLIGSFHFGGYGNDTLVGSDRFDLLIGSKNDDTIMGMGGLDLAFGNKGDDMIQGGDGLDLVFGGKGDDTLSGDDGVDMVVGGSGDDIVNGGEGMLDLLFGGSGNDVVHGNGGFDIAFGGSGQDFVYGDSGVIDLLFGGSDNDSVLGGDGIDLIFGGSGRDEIIGGEGAVDLLFGQSETDIVRGEGGIDVMFGNGDSDWMEGGAGVDLVWASDGGDVIYGGSELDILFGEDGSDCIWGESGLDLIFGGEGSDQLVGGSELDLIVGSGGDDAMFGGSGVDVMLGGDGQDDMDGGAGLDIMLGGGDEDLLHGGSAMDVMAGGDADDCLVGEAGFDIALGGDGVDLLLGVDVGIGGSGDDDIQTGVVGFGGGGTDRVVQEGLSLSFFLGGSGNDRLYIQDGGGFSFVFGGGGDDTITAPGAAPVGGGYDTHAFLFGGDDDDRIQGSRGKTWSFGGLGDDEMSGDPTGDDNNDDERDWVFGMWDSDALYGDKNNKKDYLFRGAGNDPAKTRDEWPAGWEALHAEPTFGSCEAMPTESFCDALTEPPSNVGAKG